MKQAMMTGALMITFVCGGLAADALHLRAQSSDQQILPALLAEVRGLRAAMEQMASAGPRIQLTFGRLQLQEQRISNLLRRLDPIREKLAEARKAQAEHDRQGQGYAAEATKAATGSHEREQLESVSAREQRLAGESAAEVQRLIGEESSLSAEIATEQARWTDINQRLEELDRALARR
jgi:chaperonin cofactor prefoldin